MNGGDALVPSQPAVCVSAAPSQPAAAPRRLTEERGGMAQGAGLLLIPLNPETSPNTLNPETRNPARHVFPGWRGAGSWDSCRACPAC